MGAGQVEEVLLVFVLRGGGGGRMMEKKTAMPKKETERGSASLEAQGQLSHVTSSCFWKKRKWGKRKGLLT